MVNICKSFEIEQCTYFREHLLYDVKLGLRIIDKAHYGFSEIVVCALDKRL